MSSRRVFTQVALALMVFAGALALRRMFLYDMMPAVTWDQEPRALWALGIAFLLCSIQYISLVVGALIIVATLGQRSEQHAARPLKVSNGT
jgi:hypothetical protein